MRGPTDKRPLLLTSMLILLLMLISWQLISCSRSNKRPGRIDLKPVEAKEVTLPIIERYYLLVKYAEPVCGFEDTEIPKPVCWSDRANYHIKFNHTRKLAEDLTFCNGTLLQLPDSIYEALEGHDWQVLNSAQSHLNAVALIDGVASIQLIKKLGNNKGTGTKMKYDAQMILDDLLYRAASEKSIEFFSTYKGHKDSYLHRPKFTDLITRLNVYLSTNIPDRTTFLDLPTHLELEMRSQATTLNNMYRDTSNDLTMVSIMRGFGLGESDFASLNKPIYLEKCTHEPDRQLIAMDFVYRTSQKITYLLPYDPNNPKDPERAKSMRFERAEGEESGTVEEYQESIIDMAKRRLLDTMAVVY